MQPFIPHGQINIYRFVPLDETYQNTLHFPNRAAQLSYFGCVDNDTPVAPVADTIMKLRYTGQTFTRNERQYIRIEANATMLYDCNYMAYQNRQFGNMWFFAFIHSVEYIGNNVCEVYFEIDVMQSFMWNYELRECFVLREHTLTDRIGDSLTSETVPPLTYKVTHTSKTEWFADYCVLMITAFSLHPYIDPEFQNYTFKKIGNTPMGGDILAFVDNGSGQYVDIDDAFGYLDDLIKDITDNHGLEGIVTMILFPTDFAPHNDDESQIYKSFWVARPTDIDGYTPVNNKLFTYPYTFLSVDNNENSQNYKFELFAKDSSVVSDSRVMFRCVAALGCKPQLVLIPVLYDIGNYQTIHPSTDVLNITESIVLTNFPPLFYTGDNFANWWGANGTSWQIKTTLDIMSTVAGVMTQNPTTTIINAGNIAQDVGNIITQMHMPRTPQNRGSVMTDITSETQNFYFKTVQLPSQLAKMVDDIFTMTGYAVNEVKVPNIRNYSTCRPHFNYIKCREMSFHWDEFINPQGEGKGTSVPQKYMKKIISIYQNGITFWKNPLEVGRYDTLKYSNRANVR